jgi:hypothetical protein
MYDELPSSKPVLVPIAPQLSSLSLSLPSSDEFGDYVDVPTPALERSPSPRPVPPPKKGNAKPETGYRTELNISAQELNSIKRGLFSKSEQGSDVRVINTSGRCLDVSLADSSTNSEKENTSGRFSSNNRDLENGNEVAIINRLNSNKGLIYNRLEVKGANTDRNESRNLDILNTSLLVNQKRDHAISPRGHNEAGNLNESRTESKEQKCAIGNISLQRRNVMDQLGETLKNKKQIV